MSRLRWCIVAVTVLLVLTACASGGGTTADDQAAGPAESAPTAATDLGPDPAAPGLHADLSYATTSSAQVLDLWTPSTGTAPAPLVVYVHGGAWQAGDKSDVEPKVQPLLDAGYAVASVNYRLSPEATFPAGAQDVKAAVRWLRANAHAFAVDPERFAAWGESAGGTLVALLGTTGDQATLLDDPALGNAETSSAVQAVVDWYGPIDLLLMQAQADSGPCTPPFDHDGPDSPESNWFGAPLQSVPDTAAEADPITYIATATRLPAFSIAHGTADCQVPFEQSQLLADALAAAGETPQLLIEPTWQHGDPLFDSQLMTPTIEWLNGVLGT